MHTLVHFSGQIPGDFVYGVISETTKVRRYRTYRGCQNRAAGLSQIVVGVGLLAVFDAFFSEYRDPYGRHPLFT
jgi:hypothetical protein